MSFAKQFARKFQRSKSADEDAVTDFENSSLLLDETAFAAAQAARRGKGKGERGKSSSAEKAVTAPVRLPLLGYAPAAVHRRRLLWAALVFMAAFVALGSWSLWQFFQSRKQLDTALQALTQSQRQSKAVAQTLSLGKAAFIEVNDSADQLRRYINALVAGDAALGVPALGATYASELDAINTLREDLEKNVQFVAAQLQVVVDVDTAVEAISGLGASMLEAARALFALKATAATSAEELQALAHLLALTQRIPVLALSIENFDGINDNAARQLAQEIEALGGTIQALLDANTAARQASAVQTQARAQLQGLVAPYNQVRRHAATISSHLETIKTLRQTRFHINRQGEAMRQALVGLQQRLQAGTMSLTRMAALALLLGLSALSAFGMMHAQALENQRRQQLAEQQAEEIRQRELEAKRINDANQVAILRLMNEMQSVAEGDLTQQATVTEDITGAIADSVNYTVEELRALVANVQSTVERVTQTTTQVDATSSELLNASTEQLREIRESGRAVLEMAERITEVSGQAQQSAQVAHQSLQAADSGLTAVQNTIGGMNAIRDQIQETSKRIKRLGESSQEIGEITELISDITEQTNVLALNAAIQAASAGEAGRGFSVVAEEVQRLAERSASATQRIASLVKTIQGDTQDTMAAMERSTQGVVEGARLSDSAGVALREIDTVVRQLADLIGQIAQTTSHEAQLAGNVARSMQNIFTVTEQTGEGTRNTARLVRELTRMAEELRHSVDRFKIA